MSQQLLPSTEKPAEHAMSPPKGELYALHVETTINIYKKTKIEPLPTST